MSTLKVENIAHTNNTASATITSDGYFLPKKSMHLEPKTCEH